MLRRPVEHEVPVCGRKALFLAQQPGCDSSAKEKIKPPAPCLCLFQHVIRGNRPIKTEMAHQLYVLQVLTFNLLEERMMTKMDPNDQVGAQWNRAFLAQTVCSSV